MRNAIKLAVTCLSLMVLVGCQTTTAVRDPAYAPVRPAERDAVQTAAPATGAQGSIYRAGREISLFEDQRARRVGDILTNRGISGLRHRRRSSKGSGHGQQRVNKQ